MCTYTKVTLFTLKYEPLRYISEKEILQYYNTCKDTNHAKPARYNYV